MKVSMKYVKLYVFFQVNSQESRAYVHLMDLDIVLGSDPKYQPIFTKENSRCLCSLAVNAFDLMISSTD